MLGDSSGSYSVSGAHSEGAQANFSPSVSLIPFGFRRGMASIISSHGVALSQAVYIITDDQKFGVNLGVNKWADHRAQKFLEYWLTTSDR